MMDKPVRNYASVFQLRTEAYVTELKQSVLDVLVVNDATACQASLADAHITLSPKGLRTMRRIYMLIFFDFTY